METITKRNKKEYIMGTIFMIWFIASILGMFTPYTPLSIFIVGQYFFVFGLAAMYSKVLVSIVFLLLGYLLMIGAMIYHNYNRISAIISDPSLKVLCLPIIAVLLLIISIIYFIKYFKKPNNKYFYTFIVINLLSIVMLLII